MTSKEALLLLAALLTGALGGYATSHASEPSPDMCADYPSLCQPCVGASCPQGKSGWLCCSRSGTCVEANGSCPSDYIFGYCKNYTVDGTGAAICHE